MFIEELEKRGLDYCVKRGNKHYMLARNSHEVFLRVKEAIAKKYKFYFEPDPDPDGYLSVKSWQYMLDKLDYKYYEIGVLTKRVHHVDPAKIMQKLKEGYRVIVLADSSTNDIEMIDEICNYRFEDGTAPILIIIDHHMGNFSFERYPKECTIVNPKLEPEDVPYYMYSAGMLNSTICNYILRQYGFPENRELDFYGYITMYSDNCPIMNAFAANLIMDCLHSTTKLPPIVKVFWDDYSALNNSFISFKMVPLINALLRMNKFDLADQLFFHTETIVDKAAYVRTLVQIRDASKAVLSKLMETISVEGNYEQMVIAVAPSGMEDHVYNHLGLVATKLAAQYKKIALCLMYNADTHRYTGSARDSYNRDILSEFSTFFEESAGHASAFGVSIEESKLPLVSEIIAKANLEGKKEPFVIDLTSLTSNTEIEVMALYNEMTISALPRAYLRVNIDGSFNITQNTAKTKTTALAGTLKIVAFNQPIERYSQVICMPRYNGTHIECTVEKEM